MFRMAKVPDNNSDVYDVRNRRLTFKQATFLIIFIIKFNFTLKYNLFKNLPNHVSLV